MTEQITPELDMYDQWRKRLNQKHDLTFAELVRCPHKAQLFIRLIMEASDEYQERFMKDPEARKIFRACLNHWEQPRCPLVKVKNMSTNENNFADPRAQREFDLCVDGVPIHISIAPFDDWYKVQTSIATVSYHVDRNGLVSALDDEKLKAFAFVTRMCKEHGYAHL